MPRRLLLLSLFFLCTACYPKLMPVGPVVDDEDAFLGGPSSSGVSYGSLERVIEAPVLPFLPWGLDFDEEMLFEFGAHPTYGMVEITRIRSREGREEWFALVSEHSGVQHVVVGGARAIELARTFPAPVWEGELDVVAVRSARQVQYRARFVLPSGEKVDAVITSRGSGRAPPLRNGNGMNHSEDTVLAVLDLEESNWASAEVRLDGKLAPVRWLAPFLPFAWRLEQAAGGLRSGTLWMETAEDGGLVAEEEATGSTLQFEAEVAGDVVRLRQRGALLDTHWTFDIGAGPSGPWELRSVEVLHGEVSTFRARFNPSLPDLRYLPEAGHESFMVAGSNGMTGYMTGRVRIGSSEGDVVVDVLPDQPSWACERPVRNRLNYIRSGVGEDSRMGVRLEASVEAGLAAGGSGREACR